MTKIGLLSEVSIIGNIAEFEFLLLQISIRGCLEAEIKCISFQRDRRGFFFYRMWCNYLDKEYKLICHPPYLTIIQNYENRTTPAMK